MKMNNKHIDELLKSLSSDTQEKPETVSQDEIDRKIKSMMKLGFCFDKQSLNLLQTYMNTKSGIMLVGSVGVGKTFFFKALQIPILPMQRICEHTMVEIRSALEAHEDDEILIDDIGTEGAFNNYGTSVNILSYIIEARLSNSYNRTHFTSNMTINEITERYGTRVLDRMNELAKIINYNGQSKRRPDGARIDTEDFFLPKVWNDCSKRCRFYDEASRVCTKRVIREPVSVERCPWF